MYLSLGGSGYVKISMVIKADQKERRSKNIVKVQRITNLRKNFVPHPWNLYCKRAQGASSLYCCLKLIQMHSKMHTVFEFGNISL